MSNRIYLIFMYRTLMNESQASRVQTPLAKVTDIDGIETPPSRPWIRTYFLRTYGVLFSRSPA